MTIKIKVTCDYCDKEIPNGILYGSLKIPMLNEVNFCGVSCFDDWIKSIYLKEE